MNKMRILLSFLKSAKHLFHEKVKLFLWSQNFDTDIWHTSKNMLHTRMQAPDTFLASPIPSHFHLISLHFLLILKSIAAPPELSVWNGVTQSLLFGGKNLKLQLEAESPHFKLYNDGNKLMRLVWQHYLQWWRKEIKCELKAITKLFL